jgi:hypothetical protein
MTRAVKLGEDGETTRAIRAGERRESNLHERVASTWTAYADWNLDAPAHDPCAENEGGLLRWGNIRAAAGRLFVQILCFLHRYCTKILSSLASSNTCSNAV